MSKVSLINGSPKGAHAASQSWINRLVSLLDVPNETVLLNVKGKYQDKIFEELMKSEAIVISFPLYYYVLPGILQDFLQQFFEYSQSIKKDREPIKVYAIVNCGFPEAQINEEAVKVIKNFCMKMKFDFRFAVQIGAGGFFQGMQQTKLFKKDVTALNHALLQIKNDISLKSSENNQEAILIKPSLPKPILLFFVSQNWYHFGKKNGLTKSELFRRPYQ